MLTLSEYRCSFYCRIFRKIYITITLAQIHIVTVMLSILRAYVELEAGPNLADQGFREQELDPVKQFLNRHWCGHNCLGGAAKLIRKG